MAHARRVRWATGTSHAGGFPRSTPPSPIAACCESRTSLCAAVVCVCESRALLYVAVVCIVRADGYAHGRTLYSFLPARLPLCSVCVEGYFEQFGRCAQCPPSAGASVVTMIGIGLLLLFVCFFVYFIRTILPVDILKLGLSMLQVTLAPLGAMPCCSVPCMTSRGNGSRAVCRDGRYGCFYVVGGEVWCVWRLWSCVDAALVRSLRRRRLRTTSPGRHSSRTSSRRCVCFSSMSSPSPRPTVRSR